MSNETFPRWDHVDSFRLPPFFLLSPGSEAEEFKVRLRLDKQYAILLFGFTGVWFLTFQRHEVGGWIEIWTKQCQNKNDALMEMAMEAYRIREAGGGTLKKREITIVARRPAGAKHCVAEGLVGAESPYQYRKTPCDECPWRRDTQPGAFPAEAYRISANTAHDLSGHQFACHMAGLKFTTCAGFLLRGADHNLAVRKASFNGDLDQSKVSDGGFPLYESYREMAEANGVPADDPALEKCR